MKQTVNEKSQWCRFTVLLGIDVFLYLSFLSLVFESTGHVTSDQLVT